jgi:hypothetical protein
VPQHHSFLEVLLGASEHCGAAALAAGAECWANLLPSDVELCVPSGPRVDNASLVREIEAEMRGEGDICANLLQASQTTAAYALDFDKYRRVWPSHWLSPARQRELSRDYDAMLRETTA